jgi:hypothetical protein
MSKNKFTEKKNVLSMVACVYNPSTPGRLRQENCEFKTSLGYIKKTALKKKKRKKERKRKSTETIFVFCHFKEKENLC